MSTEQANHAGVISGRAFWDLCFLSGVAALLFLPALGARDFWAPGEPIYGEAVRVMFERGNWLIPTVNGQIYADKPVLYFWLALLFSTLAGGVSEWTARLPAALGGIGMVLTTYHFGKTFYGRDTGLWAALILATSSRLLWESRFLRLDTVLSFFLFLGFYFFLKAFTGKGARRGYLAAYLCFALATLTKGPIGLVLPGLAALALIAFTGSWRKILEMRLVAGAAIVAAVIAPWLLLLHLRGEDQWLRDFIWVHNVQNYALEPIGHVRPFYYYLVNLPPDFLPWTLFVPGALIYYYPWRARLRDPASVGLLCWFGAVFLFFTASKSKIAYYLLPLLPALALFVANYLRDLTAGRERAGAHWRVTAISLYALGVCLFLAGAVLPPLVYKIERPLLVWSLVLAGLLVGGGVAMLVLLRRKNLATLFGGFVTLLLALALAGFVGVLPYLDRYKSPRPIGEFVRQRIDGATRVYVFQSKMSDFNYYARRDTMPVIPSWAGVDRLAASSPALILLVDDKDLKTIGPRLRYTVLKEQPVGDRKWYVMQISAGPS